MCGNGVGVERGLREFPVAGGPNRQGELQCNNAVGSWGGGSEKEVVDRKSGEEVSGVVGAATKKNTKIYIATLFANAFFFKLRPKIKSSDFILFNFRLNRFCEKQKIKS